MLHLRERYAYSRLRKLLGNSPIVGILGHRQVGKTTLIESCSKEYLSFDREEALLLAEKDPFFFLSDRKSPFGIDEAQLCPKLFPALKEFVRSSKKPGQFLLSGSVKFTSRAAIRESLTGRIVNIELLPFNLRELESESISDFLIRLHRVSTSSQLENLFSKRKSFTESDFFKFLECGGLPGIALTRDASIRREKWADHIDTLLNRDIRLVSKTQTPFPNLRALLSHLAVIQGEPFELKAASVASQISTITIKKILPAFEALFFIRTALAAGPERKPVFFFEDQGLATWIRGQGHFARRQEILRGLYSNMRHELHYRPDLNGKVGHFRNRNGAYVPLVFQWDKSECVGVIPIEEREPSSKTLGSARSFLNAFPKAKVVIATQGKDVGFRSPSIFILPAWSLI